MIGSSSLRGRPLPEEIGEGECLDRRPEDGGVEVEHLHDLRVLLGVVRGQQLGRHLVVEEEEVSFSYLVVLRYFTGWLWYTKALQGKVVEFFETTFC